MDVLRLILFAGLVFHKLVWEILKRKAGQSGGRPSTSPGVVTRIIKYLKGAVLIGLVIQTLFLDVMRISDEPSGLRLVGTLIFILGLGIAVTGRMQLGRNWANLEDYQILQGQALVKKGLYRYIRHPIYAGDLLLLIGLELALNSWLVIGMVIPLLVILRQMAKEEALLTQVLAGYEEYRKQTKQLIPFII